MVGFTAVRLDRRRADPVFNVHEEVGSCRKVAMGWLAKARTDRDFSRFPQLRTRNPLIARLDTRKADIQLASGHELAGGAACY